MNIGQLVLPQKDNIAQFISTQEMSAIRRC